MVKCYLILFTLLWWGWRNGVKTGEVTGQLKSSEQRCVLGTSSERCEAPFRQEWLIQKSREKSHLKGNKHLVPLWSQYYLSIEHHYLWLRKCAPLMTNRGKSFLYMVFVFFSFAYIMVVLYFCYFTFLSHQCPCCKGPAFVCFFVLPNLPWTNIFGLHPQFNEMSLQRHAWRPQQCQTAINISKCLLSMFVFLISCTDKKCFCLALVHRPHF